MLTKKDFELLAIAMQASKPQVVPPPGVGGDYMRGRDEQWCLQIKALCDALEHINPRFKRETFLHYVETNNYTGTGSRAGGGYVSTI